LHDAFVQFVLRKPAIHEIENIDAYLARIVRNLWVSEIRRHAQHVETPLDVVEYESILVKFRSSDSAPSEAVREELLTICNYACLRKETSRSTCAFILRFFHGFQIEAITRILCCTKPAVYECLKQARKEAKLFRDEPQRLKFRSASQGGHVLLSTQAPVPRDADFVQWLRDMIAASRQGTCLAPIQLRDLYAFKDAPPPSQLLLAHIVSCPECLGIVVSALRLPPVSSSSNGEEPPAGLTFGKPKPRSGNARNCTFSDHLASVYDHRPAELRMTVNGFWMLSQRVSAQNNEQEMSIQLSESIAFVEVFSEQDIRLFYLAVEAPPAGPIEQSASVDLSDGRRLDVTISFDRVWPRIRVVYSDPALPGDAAETDKVDEVPEKSHRRAFVGLGGSMRRLRAFLVATSLFLLFCTIWMLSGLISDVPGAATLVVQASREEIIDAPRNQAVRRVMRVEEVSPANGQVTAARNVEVWKHETRVRRIVDGNRVPADAPSLSSPAAPPASLMDATGLEPSAAHFQQLIGDIAECTVEEYAAVYVIRWKHTDPNQVLVDATLSVRKGDFHAVEQTFTVRNHETLIQFRLVELTVETVPADRIPAGLFEAAEKPLPGSADSGSSEFRPDLQENVAGRAPSLELEIQVLHLLNRAGALEGEQVDVNRHGEKLEVEALVDSDKRKSELLDALAPVDGDPLVEVRIQTIEEAVARMPARPLVENVVRDLEIEFKPTALESELRDYFKSRVPSEEIQGAVRAYADRMLNQAWSAGAHARALKQIVSRISAARLASLNGPSILSWREMVQDHAKAVERHTALLGDLLAALQISTHDSAPDVQPAPTLSELDDGIGKLFEMVSFNDAALRNGLSISMPNEASHPIRPDTLSQSLIETENLARAIYNAAAMIPRS
jgi:DNA-directed RNA polymerase specialized sigma24 family protein